MKKTQSLPLTQIEAALLKKALGYDCDEVVEEYIIDEDGNAKLSKKKVTKKYVSPDIPAAKVLLESFENKANKYENMTEEELQKEKIRLIKLLQNGEDDGN